MKVPATRRRTLNDLFLIGTPVEVTTSKGSVVVWMQKLDPFDHDRAVSKAKAARARAKATYNDHDSDEYMAVVDTVQQAQRDELVAQVTAPERAKLVESATSEFTLGEDSEWAKDGYLAGLWDEWNAGLSARYEDDPDDVDAKRVLGELTRFDADLEAAIKPQVEQLHGQYESIDDDTLRVKATESLVERQINEAWLEAFTAAEVWLSTRRPCPACERELAEQHRRIDAGEPPLGLDDYHRDLHDGFYFDNVEAVMRLERPVREYLEAIYLQLSVDPTEGKGSPESGASSSSSDSTEPADMAPLSGQTAPPA